MAIDLPPAAVLDEPAAVRQFAAGSAQSIDHSAGRVEVHGVELLDANLVREHVQAAPDAERISQALLALYREQGWLGTAVASVEIGGVIKIWVYEAQISEVDAAPELKPYFEDLVGRRGIPRAALARALSLAGDHATLAGYSNHVLYVRDQDRPGDLNLVLRTRDERGSPWEFSAGYANTGSRYIGSHGAAIGAGYGAAEGYRLRVGYEGAITAFGDVPDDTRSNQLSANWETVTRMGQFEAFGSFHDYGFQGPGRGQRLDLVDPEGQELSEGRTTRVGIGAQQILDASRRYQLTLGESVERVADDFRTPDGNRVDETFVAAGLSLAIATDLPERTWLPALKASAEISRGLDGRIRSAANADAEPDYTRLRSSGALEWVVGTSTAIQLNGEYQFADVPLPRQQELLLGGMHRLSAWLPGIVTGDSGGLLRLTYSRRVSGPWQWPLILSGFGEFGSAQFDVDAPATAELADAGLALAAALPGEWRAWSMELVAAKPVHSQGIPAAVLEANRINAFLRIRREWDTR